MTINYFFEVPQVHNYLVKSEDEEVFKMDGSDSEFIRLSGDFPNRKLEAMITIIPPEHKHEAYLQPSRGRIHIRS